MNEQYINDLMQKYNVTEQQIEQVIEKIYTDMIHTTYKDNTLKVKIKGNNIEIYDEKNQQLESPTPTADMAFSLKKNLIYELTNIQQLNEYEEFKDRVGELFQLKIINILNNKLIVALHGVYSGEMTMPVYVNMRNYRIGSFIYGLLDKVYNNSYNSHDTKKYGRQLVFENLSNNFMYALVKHFIPYISNNIVQICNIVRSVGKRTKIVVTSSDNSINAASVCIGKNGDIAKKIYEALNGEYIDFINEAHDLQGKIKSYCKPYNVVYIQTMTDNSIKIILDNRHTDNLQGLINKTNIMLLNKLLFTNNNKVQLVFRTVDEYKLEISESQQQLYQLLLSEGISIETAAALVNKFSELNDLIFVKGINIDEKDNEILKKITANRLYGLKQTFISENGEPEFFDYSIYRFTRDEFMRLQLADMISFEDIIQYNAIELAQIMNWDISFSSTLIDEIKAIIKN